MMLIGDDPQCYPSYRDIALPAQGIRLVVIDYSLFQTNAKGRLQRREKDREIIRDFLFADHTLGA